MNQVNESTPTKGRAPSSRAAGKRLNFAIGYFAAVLSACALMMWGVFNTWLNILQYRADAAADLKLEQDWGVAAIVVVVTCIIPFLIGLGLLFKALGNAKLLR